MLVYNLNDTFLVLLKLYGKLITNFVKWVVKSPAGRIENISWQHKIWRDCHYAKCRGAIFMFLGVFTF